MCYDISFMTSPYDLDYVDSVYKYVDAYKIGSGDINWIEIIKKIASKKKPLIIASGASTFNEVKESIKTALKFTIFLLLR